MPGLNTLHPNASTPASSDAHFRAHGVSMFRVIPQLVVSDIQRSVAFYSETLGFRVSLEDPPGAPEFVTMERDEASVFLISEASREDPEFIGSLRSNRRGVGVRLYIELDDAAALYAKLRGDGMAVARELTRNEAENYSEFLIDDPDGYQIGVYS